MTCNVICTRVWKENTFTEQCLYSAAQCYPIYLKYNFRAITHLRYLLLLSQVDALPSWISKVESKKEYILFRSVQVVTMATTSDSVPTVIRHLNMKNNQILLINLRMLTFLRLHTFIFRLILLTRWDPLCFFTNCRLKTDSPESTFVS